MNNIFSIVSPEPCIRNSEELDSDSDIDEIDQEYDSEIAIQVEVLSDKHTNKKLKTIPIIGNQYKIWKVLRNGKYESCELGTPTCSIDTCYHRWIRNKKSVVIN